MRTVCGWARLLGRPLRRRAPAVRPVAYARPVAAGRPLLSGEPGEQRRSGCRLDQVDTTTCGSAVLVALAAWADPAELDRLELGQLSGGRVRGFGERYDERQRQVHRQTNRFWPRAFGTTPWAMVAWLRRNVPAAGRYRVRLVDDLDAADVASVRARIDAALAAGRPVPLLVGSTVPRHYVLAVGHHGGGEWRIYEPTGGAVRVVDPALAGGRRLGTALGWDRLHAALLPA
ncbi:hypothetical protein [Pseudonocardia sp.]|uniref:hypothetical protein n=1 Tax=Pseudonocardia sp. TaxID=60912 RepID=UPI003D10B008